MGECSAAAAALGYGSALRPAAGSNPEFPFGCFYIHGSNPLHLNNVHGWANNIGRLLCKAQAPTPSPTVECGSHTDCANIYGADKPVCSKGICKAACKADESSRRRSISNCDEGYCRATWSGAIRELQSTCETTCHEAVGCQLAVCAPDEQTICPRYTVSDCAYNSKARAYCQTKCSATIGCQAAPAPAPTPPAPTPATDQGFALVGLIPIVIQIVFACLYKQKVVDQIQPLPPAQAPHQHDPVAQTDFKYGVFSCCGDTNVCLHACCCSVARLAHNTQVTGVMDYWMTVGLIILSPICAVCCVPICFQTWIRMEIKKKLGIEPDAVKDCVCASCCNCCTIAQAAREIDERSAVVVKCCCNLTQQAPASVVMGVATELATVPLATGHDNVTDSKEPIDSKEAGDAAPR